MNPEMIVFPLLDLDADDAIVGKHSVWLPQAEIKIPFQWGGRIQKYQHGHEESYHVDTIAEELAFLRWLHSIDMAPRVGRVVYFETVKSRHLHGHLIEPPHKALGPTWFDPMGAYGFEFEDATRMRPGRFDVDVLKQSGVIKGSEGAWNDIIKPQNIINGRCVDVRRSWWDRLEFLGPIEPLPRYYESPADLIDALKRDGTFPFREREYPYQEYFLHPYGWQKAEREVVNRAKILGLEIQPGDSVLDLGTCTGGFLQFASLRGSGLCVGLDYQPEFVNLARRLARADDFNICYREADLTQPNYDTLDWLRSVFRDGLDHLLVLSMGKHLGEDVMWSWIDALNANHVYLETNAVKDAPYPYANGVARRGGQLVGFTEDRNRRACYRIDS